MKRVFSLLMVLLLCLSLLPLGALASEEAEETDMELTADTEELAELYSNEDGQGQIEAESMLPEAEVETPVIETDVDSEKSLDVFTEKESLPVEEVELEVNENTDISSEIPAGNDSLDFWADGTSVTQAEAVAWAASQVGKSLDYDGYYGAQCVDFIMYYYKFLGVSPVSGNGADYAWNTLPSGWSRIQNAQPQPGDILVYTGTSSNPYGHVGIYESDYVHYDQNVSGHVGVVRCTWHYKETGGYNVYWGVIRPNFGNSTPSPGGDTVSVNFETSWRQNIGEDEITVGRIISVTGASIKNINSVGIDIYDGQGNYIKSKYENPVTSGSIIDVWYTLKSELGLTLTPGATYVYQFYAMLNGTAYYDDPGTVTVPGVAIPTINPVYFYLDVNGWTDGNSNSGVAGYGTFDVYINGSRVADDVNDYYETWPAETTYEIKDIRPAPGKEYAGVHSGALSGTIVDHTTVYLSFNKMSTYTVTYNANGGTGAPAAQTKTHGSALTLSSVKPTRSGYTFQGWATSSTATTAQYQPGGSYTNNANVTLYAVWEANAASKPTVSIAANAKTAQITGDYSGFYARVALVISTGGQSGLYVTQTAINPDGTIVIPQFMVPGLTVTGVNIALVRSIAEIPSSTPNAVASAFKML